MPSSPTWCLWLKGIGCCGVSGPLCAGSTLYSATHAVAIAASAAMRSELDAENDRRLEDLGHERGGVISLQGGRATAGLTSP